MTTLALAFPCLVAYGFLLMVGHLLTGGFILSKPWLIRGITTAVVVALVVRKFLTRRSSPSWQPRDLIPAVAVVVLALVVWGYPVMRIVPLASGGDIRWHLGWASQIMNGETTPSSILIGNIPNYYP